MATTAQANVRDLKLHRDSQLDPEECRKARLTLALLAERHGVLDQLSDFIGMLGVGEEE